MADIRRGIKMATRLVIDGNSVYEIDEDCERMCKQSSAGKYRTERMQESDSGKDRGTKIPEIKGGS